MAKRTVDERVLEAVASGGIAGIHIDFIVERSKAKDVCELALGRLRETGKIEMPEGDWAMLTPSEWARRIDDRRKLGRGRTFAADVTEMLAGHHEPFPAGRKG